MLKTFWLLLSLLLGLSLLAITTSVMAYGATYNTPSTPLLRNHSLAFEVPSGWKLVKVVTTDADGKVHPLKIISRDGQIQDWPYWDMHGIDLTFVKGKIAQRIVLFVINRWYVEDSFPTKVNFHTVSGLEGALEIYPNWWVDASGTSYDQGELLLAIPERYSVPFHADTTYGTVVDMRADIPHGRSRRIRLQLLRWLGSSLHISPLAHAPAKWQSLHIGLLPQGTSYLTPPCGYLSGRQIQLTLPIGWQVTDVSRTKAGWEKFAPKLLLKPISDRDNRRSIIVYLWVESVEDMRREAMEGGYPVELPNGLSGLLDPCPSEFGIDIYLPQSRLVAFGWHRRRGMVLEISCDLASKDDQQLAPVVWSLMMHVKIMPPQNKPIQETPSSFDPAYLSTLRDYSILSPNALEAAHGELLYGSTTFHGAGQMGMVFYLNANGTGFRVLHSFAPLQPDFSNQDGAFPFAPLAQDAHQHLYGTTSTGGPACDGTLFTLAPDGSHFHLLHAFSGPDGALPYAGVLPSKDGWLYGVTEEGGPYGKGVVYRIREDGTGFQVLHSFGGKDGAYPLLVELVEGSGGWLYGVTSGGGVYGNGVVFGVKEDGSGYRVLHEFSAEDGLGRNGDGSHPYGGLVLGLGGWLYGETYGGGGYGMGVVFRVREDGSGYRVLHTFTGGVEGSHALGSLLLWGEKLYGVCSEGGRLGGGCVFVLGVGGEGYRVLHSFGVDREGWTGLGGLVLLGSEWLYGVTEGGGVGGEGVVYRLRADGSGFGVVYDFGKRLGQASQR